MAEEETKRVVLGAEDVANLSTDLLTKWRSMESYVDNVEKKNSTLEGSVLRVTGTRDWFRKSACYHALGLT